VSLTGIAILNGATVGTDKGIAYLYDSAGQLVASSALAGATTAGADAFQTYAFVTAPTVQPGRYFIVYQQNGTTDTVRTIAASTFIDCLTSSATGTFATALNFTPPTTITADQRPDRLRGARQPQARALRPGTRQGQDSHRGLRRWPATSAQRPRQRLDA
jgi:hypothetical protein